MSAEIQPTEHPYVVRHPTIGNGEPIIKDTRIAVRLIAGYYKRGAAVEEIERDYPFLSAAAIHDAISYYLDHQEEIEALLEANRIENVLTMTGLAMAAQQESNTSMTISFPRCPLSAGRVREGLL